MSKKIDLTGKRYGRLLAMKAIGSNDKGSVLWECLCDCGTKIVIPLSSLRSGNTKSCGCLKRDTAISRNTVHGKRYTESYKTWVAMIQRCTNKKTSSYFCYGGRGITICKQWLKFENFFKDMGERPLGFTIERINNNKGYTPENCQWITQRENLQKMPHVKINQEIAGLIRLIFDRTSFKKRAIGKFLNISEHIIYAVLSGRTWANG